MIEAHAWSRQTSTCAPSAPLGSSHRKVGRRDVAVDAEIGAIKRGIGGSIVHPLPTHEAASGAPADPSRNGSPSPPSGLPSVPGPLARKSLNDVREPHAALSTSSIHGIVARMDARSFPRFARASRTILQAYEHRPRETSAPRMPCVVSTKSTFTVWPKAALRSSTCSSRSRS